MKKRRFYGGIVLPALLAVGMFITVIYLILIPSLEKNIMERKKEMLRELTYTARSLIREYYEEETAGIYSRDEAQDLAAQKIERMRYGSEGKDYFWITDLRPYMIMHPYTPRLNGKSLDAYADPAGKRIFVEARDLVREQSEGYLDYQWQWKDDSSRIVPKLSFVSGFEPWGWIVGTGIYLEDVQQEIKAVKGRMFRISGSISLFTFLLLFWVIRQSHRIEMERRRAEVSLLESREKYKSLVEASTDGTLILEGEKVIFANYTFAKTCGYELEEIYGMHFRDLFVLSLDSVMDSFVESGKSVKLETSLKMKSDSAVPVLLTASQTHFSGMHALILIVRRLSRMEYSEKSDRRFSDEALITAAHYSLKVSGFLEEIPSCDISTALGDALALLQKSTSGMLYVRHQDRYAGYLNAAAILAVSNLADKDRNQPVSAFMKSPVPRIPIESSISEALSRMQHLKIPTLLVSSSSGKIQGMVSEKELLRGQSLYFMVMQESVKQVQDSQELYWVFPEMVSGVKAYIDSGIEARLISRLITTVSDEVYRKADELARRECGLPPCRYALIVLGSEGRMEQSLKTDQDNALIYEDGSERENRDRKAYFLRLGEVINKKMDQAGYALCKGEMMAGNPRWNMSLTEWKKTFSTWMKNSDPESILYSSVFFDFRYMAGEPSLVRELEEQVDGMAVHEAVFLKHMADAIHKLKLPVGIFGGITGESGTEGGKKVDLKKLLFPITAFARVYALKYGFSERNTTDRLQRLREEGKLSEKLLSELLFCHEQLMQWRYRTQVQQYSNNEPPGNALDLNRLNEIERGTLRLMISSIQDINTQLNFDF